MGFSPKYLSDEKKVVKISASSSSANTRTVNIPKENDKSYDLLSFAYKDPSHRNVLPFEV